MDLTFPFDTDVDVRDLAWRAEASGYSCGWISEVKHDPFIGLAVVATTTRTLELGTAIALAFARNPMLTAVAAMGQAIDDEVVSTFAVVGAPEEIARSCNAGTVT
jgi:alkanesulfonate monooxygenase SsuD/methylene tetrahydromethanopterin reductase-like flavin-dependent oxidoreductase (luciferase family)